MDPDQYAPPDQHPQLSIASFYLSSASYTSTRGGFFDYTLVLQNALNAERAVNIRGDFTARTSDGIVAVTSVAFDQLDGGQTETGYVQLELTRPPGRSGLHDFVD